VGGVGASVFHLFFIPQCHLRGVYSQNLGQGARPRPKFWCLGWVTQHVIGQPGVIVSKYPMGLEPSGSGLSLAADLAGDF